MARTLTKAEDTELEFLAFLVVQDLPMTVEDCERYFKLKTIRDE